MDNKEKEIVEKTEVVDVPEEKPAAKKKAAPKTAKAEEVTEEKKPAAKKKTAETKAKTAKAPKEEPPVKAEEVVAAAVEEQVVDVVEEVVVASEAVAETNEETPEKPVEKVAEEAPVVEVSETETEAVAETSAETPEKQVEKVAEEAPVVEASENKAEAMAKPVEGAKEEVGAKPATGTDFPRGRRPRGDQRGDGRRDNRRRFNDRDKEKEFEERVVAINRVTKVVKGGRRFRFSALVVVGDKKGRVGMGTGKANEVPDAIKKAIENAKKDLFRVPLVGNSLPHAITGVYGAGEVFMKPASEGTGVIAGGPVRAVLELAGYKDVLSKCIGSRTPINMVRATVQGLKSLRTLNDVAKIRDMKPEEVRK